MNDNKTADWSAKAASEARDEQRRRPRWYPSTRQEQLRDEYEPEPDADMGRMEHDDKGDN